MELLTKIEPPKIDSQWTIRPCIGEDVSGDSVHVLKNELESRVVLIDALGHGPEASETAQYMMHELDSIRSMDVSYVLEQLHQRSRKTRGAAISVVCISSLTMDLVAATIGNTTVKILNANSQEQVPASNGTIGISMRTPNVYRRKLQVENRVLLFSDGISSRFSGEIYARLMYMSPKSSTQMIVRRYGKRFDDATAAMIAFEPT
jgi:negative regulator of sigma-B (phosphoserine phosphatase)